MKKIVLIYFFLINALTFAQTGITWLPSLDVASSSNSDLHPRIVIDGSGNPLIIWGKLSTNECKFSRWDGAMFTTPVVLNPSAIPVFTQTWAGPDIASKG